MLSPFNFDSDPLPPASKDPRNSEHSEIELVSEFSEFLWSVSCAPGGCANSENSEISERLPARFVQLGTSCALSQGGRETLPGMRASREHLLPGSNGRSGFAMRSLRHA